MLPGLLCSSSSILSNHSLLQSEVPTCFKKTAVIPVPKKTHAGCPNDYCPVALMSMIMKSSEKLVMAHINTTLPNCLDPLQFIYKSTADVISLALHLSLKHLDNKDTDVRLLLIDYSSAFSTLIPNKLIPKHQNLGLSSPLCNWILDFLTHRLQSVRISDNTSSTIILNTSAPQGCVLSPLLYSLYTHKCVAKFCSNSIYKFADDTTVVGQISDNDITEYRKKIECLAAWCKDNNLSINVSKMKELIIDFRKQSGGHTLVCINGAEVEMVESVRFLGVMITNNLSWITH
eukprot:g23504.t1